MKALKILAISEHHFKMALNNLGPAVLACGEKNYAQGFEVRRGIRVVSNTDKL